MLEIDRLKQELEKQFPELIFFKTRRVFGSCIVAKRSKFYGADIFIRGNKIFVEAAIPNWTTRFFLGAGAVYLKLKDSKYEEVAR